MQWTAIFLLAAAQLAAVSASPRDPTATAKPTGCKHKGNGNHKNDAVTPRAIPGPTPTPTWAKFTLDGQEYTGSAPAWFTIDGANLQPGGKVHVRNTILRLPTDLNSLLVRHLGETTRVPVTTEEPHTKGGKKGDKNPLPTPTGEPEGKPPGPNSNNNGDPDDNDDCGADPSDSASGTDSDSSTGTDQSSAAQTSLGGIQITSSTPDTTDMSSPTMAPSSSSTGAAGAYSVAPWFGAAAAGFAWVFV